VIALTDRKLEASSYARWQIPFHPIHYSIKVENKSILAKKKKKSEWSQQYTNDCDKFRK
jgi:hypothetical protein